VAGELLSRDNLQTAEAVFGLGMVIVRALQEGKPITIFFNQEGQVELAPYNEVLLDTLPEEEAIEALINKGYSEELILNYLNGRRARTEA
jgi:hypothetical protein